ncbi:MAG: hypothetical protein IT381_14190 [Deltaproteobacteria bacterium]|nr:hypothetical protein [Deltaproteobacteria bacterium]
MGFGGWCFLRARPGELRPIARRAIDAFFFDGGRLPPDADGFVRYAEVIVKLEDRRAVEVARVGFIQHQTIKDGRLDRKHLREVMASAAESAFGGLKLFPRAAGVVSAEHKFAKRRLQNLSQWVPNEDERRLLRELVNQKAGKQIM